MNFSERCDVINTRTMRNQYSIRWLMTFHLRFLRCRHFVRVIIFGHFEFPSELWNNLNFFFWIFWNKTSQTKKILIVSKWRFCVIPGQLLSGYIVDILVQFSAFLTHYQRVFSNNKDEFRVKLSYSTALVIVNLET